MNRDQAIFALAAHTPVTPDGILAVIRLLASRWPDRPLIQQAAEGQAARARDAQEDALPAACVFLVLGTAGSYTTEDWVEWPVAVYTKAADAHEHARRAQRWAARIITASRQWEMLRAGVYHVDAETTWFDGYGNLRRANPYDSAMSDIRTPMRYQVYTLALNPHAFHARIRSHAV